MTTVEVLRKARELVAAGWTQGHYAEDADGEPVETSDPKACKFCMAGALFRVTDDLGDEQNHLWREAKNALKAVVAAHTVVEFNDTDGRTRDEVVAAFDRAIAAAEASS